MQKPAFTVSYRGIDGEWFPFMRFTRNELAQAADCARRMGQSHALKTEWRLQRGRKTILRVPVSRYV